MTKGGKWKMKKMILVLLLVLFPAVVFAGEYVLVKGKGVEVCEAYGKNLNSFKPAPLMEHARKINPEFKDFTKPTWEKMYYEHTESKKLFPQIDLFLWEYDVNPAYHNMVREGKSKRTIPKQRAAAWKDYKANRQTLLSVGLPISKIDIDNDGKIENICLDNQPGILLVLNENKTDIDLEKTSLLLQHPRLPPDAEADVSDNVYYDVFIYKQKTYFDFFRRVWEEKGHDSRWVYWLQVFIIENQKTQEMCNFQFKLE
jgi:hypothetical protein